MKLSWSQVEDIALALLETYPDLDPLSIHFPDMHKRIVSLPGFSDDPKASTEGVLEAIQMAWLEEYRDAKG